MWASKVELELEGGKGAASIKTFGDVMTRYMDEHKRKLKNEYCVDTEEYRIKAILADPIAKIKLKDLQPIHFAEWRNARLNGTEEREAVSSGTVLRDFGVMSGAINMAIKEWGWMEVSPLKGIEKPEKPHSRDRRITDDEIDRLIFAMGYEYDEKPESVSARTCAAFLFALETGMRDGEAARLTMDRVFLDRRVAHLRAVDCKNKRKRDVPLSAEAIRLIKQMDVTEGLVFGVTAKQVTSAFIYAKQQAMIEGLTFHDSRHEAITRLAKKLDVLELARMVGHTNINQLLTYYNISADDLATKL